MFKRGADSGTARGAGLDGGTDLGLRADGICAGMGAVLRGAVGVGFGWGAGAVFGVGGDTGLGDCLTDGLGIDSGAFCVGLSDGFGGGVGTDFEDEAAGVGGTGRGLLCAFSSFGISMVSASSEMAMAWLSASISISMDDSAVVGSVGFLGGRGGGSGGVAVLLVGVGGAFDGIGGAFDVRDGIGGGTDTFGLLFVGGAGGFVPLGALTALCCDDALWEAAFFRTTRFAGPVAAPVVLETDADFELLVRFFFFFSFSVMCR